jgi:D-tagatose-1,6-bisphosphate aldolase subunit GatZ/KbaZ
MKIPKFCIGPMSKEIVDIIIDYSNNTKRPIWFIPSRRQVEWNGGYVNNWTTKDFCQYVRNKSSLNLIMRDHGGPHQGSQIDLGYSSLYHDAIFMDGIHIDPWKKYKNAKDNADATCEIIEYCNNINPKLFFEIGTEQAIRELSVEEMEYYIHLINAKLNPELFKKILYFVIQSGTSLKETHNTGNYDPHKLKYMTKLCNKFGFKSKEHNGDYLSNEHVTSRFNGGLDTLNIAPEFGYLQSKLILNEIKDNKEYFEEFFNICYNSKKWVKWVSEDFKPEERKEELILISGHYVFSHPNVKHLMNNIIDFDIKLKDVIIKRLDELFKE